MRKLKKLLVYVDTAAKADPALMYSERLARAVDGSVTAVDVIEPPPKWYRDLAPPGMHPSVIARDRKEHLGRLVHPIRDKGVKVTTKVLHGKPFIEVIREVLKGRYDAIVKSVNKEGSKKPFGVTDLNLLRQCPCPVVLVKPKRVVRHLRVLAAIDPAGPAALNRKIVEFAKLLSEFDASELHIAHAWQAYGEGVLSGRRVGMPQHEIREYVASERARAARSVADFLSSFGSAIRPQRVHLLKGDAGSVISKLAKTQKIHLIVMGTVARTGIPGFLFGNTAERILERIDCSVLAVKPDGFVTPVKRA